MHVSDNQLWVSFVCNGCAAGAPCYNIVTYSPNVTTLDLDSELEDMVACPRGNSSDDVNCEVLGAHPNVSK